jgi:hypothetical protein
MKAIDHNHMQVLMFLYSTTNRFLEKNCILNLISVQKCLKVHELCLRDSPHTRASCPFYDAFGDELGGGDGKGKV